MFRNILSRATSWVLKWIDTNVQFGGIIGRAKQRKLEREEENIRQQQQKPGFLESNATKEARIRQRQQLNSIKELVESLPSGKSQAFYWDRLIETLQKLGRTEETMEIGKYYTFKYWAKTRGKYFDVYPVSIIIRKGMHSMMGVNLHWRNAPQYVESMYRTYIYSGFQSKFYEIKEWELEDVMKINTFLPIKR